ncbi:UNVERIFIED_CONTAM: putative transferase, chloroplastic [Sesamum angustifolium]|uniref:Transferase, chloroplastic n=1 Tax=Sesamum angustifolium TaxID=2727405 RepID=A0AAW2QCI1_9LAMI
MSSLSAAISCTYPLRRSLHAPPSRTLRKGAFWCDEKKNKKRLSVACVLPFDISPPPIDLDPLETIIDPEAEASGDVTADTYGNDDEAVDAVDNGVAGCDTVFVTPTARTIDISHAWVMKNAIVLVVSPMTCGSIIEMLKKYIFFADKVEIQDITKQTSMFALLGPKSSKIMEDLNLGDLVGQPYGSHKHYSVGGMPLTVAVGSITSVEGFTFMMSPAAAGSVWKALLGQGAIPIGSSTRETLRILRGRPAPGKELTNEFNVLEAGLWRAVSLNKGCYKGQETISRLVTYDGIKQRIWGIRLSSPVGPGSIITIDGKKVGKLTSFTAGTKSSGPFGLGYIKRRAASERLCNCW